ncbi:pantoate--beta-alanine ligase [Streptomyces lonarensis]|uniref:Pantoate--beta-alanine ligase n=1 Tax=Streptomyces lonarensis TaxID=700599 RepID=A0A7X6D4S2_9ACTN|nr:pantoate--beta-alanine ligase [Streptomyces lonarensis]NJQ08165.1 hypothetical protein [Streptomyces lonarensis]
MTDDGVREAFGVDGGGNAVHCHTLAALDQEEASADARAVAHAAGPPDPAGAALAAADTVLREAARLDPPLETDYLALVDPATFTAIAPGDPAPPGPAVLAVAARVGATRLIDNVHLDLGTAL